MNGALGTALSSPGESSGPARQPTACGARHREKRKEHRMDQLTELWVEYALTLSYEDLPPEVVERTKCLILDTVGCALGAAPWQAPSVARALAADVQSRSEEHTSELQSQSNLVCRLLLEKKKIKKYYHIVAAAT